MGHIWDIYRAKWTPEAGLEPALFSKVLYDFSNISSFKVSPLIFQMISNDFSIFRVEYLFLITAIAPKCVIP